MTPRSLKGLESCLVHFLEDLCGTHRAKRATPLGASLYSGPVAGRRVQVDRPHGGAHPRCRRTSPAAVPGPEPLGRGTSSARLGHKMVDLLSEARVWIIDETAFPKAGIRWVWRGNTAAPWGKWRTAKWRSVSTGRVCRRTVRRWAGSTCRQDGSRRGRGPRKSRYRRERYIAARRTWPWK
jgi:hypothetical protein